MRNLLDIASIAQSRVKTPTFNLRVEIPSRFRKFENQKCLRPLLREDDRENNSAHSWLVLVFTQPGSIASLWERPVVAQSGHSLSDACEVLICGTFLYSTPSMADARSREFS
jgi:hypothetical protein